MRSGKGAKPRSGPPGGAPVAAATALALLLIAAGGAVFYSSQERLALRSVEDQLSAIAKLKIEQIVHWEGDRLADCRALIEDDFLLDSIRSFVTRNDRAAQSYLENNFDVEARREGYSDILLVDAAGKILLSLKGERGYLDPPSAAVLARALGRDAPMVTDLFRGRDDRIWIDAVAPISSKAQKTPGSLALVLRSDPAAFLYALVQSWPVPSASAETLLVESDDGSVLFLNDLRFRPGAALAFRIPKTLLDLPANMAVAGTVGVKRGRDYRGVPVLAAFAPVPGTPWYIVSKVDLAEATAPWRSLARLILVLVAFMAAAALAGSGYMWQRARLRHYRELYVAEQAKTRAEAELRDLNAELETRVHERTRELEAANAELEAFAYSVSHDLRSPLRAIDGYGSVLQEEEARRLSESGGRNLERIRSSTRQMGRLIDDLLEFARVGRIELDREKVDMNALANSVISELKTRVVPNMKTFGGPAGGDRVEFVLRPLAPVAGDSILLRQVWLNLIDNALKFSSRTDRAEIEIACEKAPSGIRYYVRDNGAGFDMRYRSKLFRVFQRLHSSQEFDGSGVGLAIVQRVVERHGGTVDAVGAVGEGATVSFTLPSAEV